MRQNVLYMGGTRTLQERSQEAEQLLGAVAERLTKQRVLVLASLLDRVYDTTAQELHAELTARGEQIGLATVYRTLGSLADAGILQTFHHEGGELSYKRCPPVHHHHLSCRSCRRVVDVPGCGLESYVASAASEHGFSEVAHSMEMVGLCPACAA